MALTEERLLHLLLLSPRSLAWPRASRSPEGTSAYPWGR